MRLLPHLVTLELDGQGFTQWTDVSISRSLESPARSFSVTAFQQRPAQVVARPGSAAVLRLNGVPIVTGWVDDIDVARDVAGSSVTFTGRSRVADLVDSAPAPGTPRRWTAAPPSLIVAALAAPFGITVTPPTVGNEPFRRFALEQNETVWDAIDRICSARGLLAIDDAAGNLTLTRLSRSTALRHVGTLQGGGNLKNWTVSHKGSQRFSTYIARGQTVGDIVTPPALAASVVGQAVDVGVSRPRYFTVDAHGLDTAGAIAKAQWEATTRYGRAITVIGEVPGWTDAAGALWTPGQLVAVRIPHAGLDTDLVIVEANASKSASGGSSTSLVLQPIEAFATYTPAPVARRGARGYEAGLINVKLAAETAAANR